MSIHKIDDKKIEIIQDISDLKFNINVSIPLGLILNEILSNSLRYAFPGDRKGKIMINCKKGNDLCSLEISDDGIGIDEAIDLKKDNTLGMTLINSLAKQLNATLEIDFSQGTKYKITFNI